MRYLTLIVFFNLVYISNAQVAGDITEDEIIDANDYLQLRNDIIKGNGFNLLADLDNDGLQSVRDLVLLYDFLYGNATDLNQSHITDNKELVNISFGTYHFQKKILEVRIRADRLKAFQFEISNIEILAIQKNDKNIYLIGNKVVGIPPKMGYYDEDIILNLKLDNGIENEYCIKNYLFLDELGNNYRTEVGDCANPSWSEEGLDNVKIDVKKNGFDILTDVDRNGKVDLKDYTILFDYLKLKGPPPPGITSETKKKVKVEFINTDQIKNSFDLIITSNDEISSFDMSLYGIKQIIDVSSDLISEFEIVNNRLLWFGDHKIKTKEIKIKVDYEKTESIKKICIRSPVFLGDNNQYFDVKLGRCLDLLSKEEESNSFANKKTLIEKDRNRKFKKEKNNDSNNRIKKEKDNSIEMSNNSKSKEDVDQFVEEELKPIDDISKLKKVNNISNREKKKNFNANNSKNKITVKILSLSRLQIKTTIGEMGQMIFNNEDNIFMIFSGTTWQKLNAVPSVSIEE